MEKGRGDREKEKEGKRTRRVSLFKYSFRVRPVEFASDHSAPRFPCPSPILLDAPPLPRKITEIRAIFERRRLFENKISHEGEGVCGKLGHGIDWKFIYFFIHSYRRAFTTFDTGFLVARGGAYRGKCLLNGGVILFLRTIFENNSWKLSVNVISFSNRNRADPFEGKEGLSSG